MTNWRHWYSPSCETWGHVPQLGKCEYSITADASVIVKIKAFNSLEKVNVTLPTSLLEM